MAVPPRNGFTKAWNNEWNRKCMIPGKNLIIDEQTFFTNLHRIQGAIFVTVAAWLLFHGKSLAASLFLEHGIIPQKKPKRNTEMP